VAHGGVHKAPHPIVRQSGETRKTQFQGQLAIPQREGKSLGLRARLEALRVLGSGGPNQRRLLPSRQGEHGQGAPGEVALERRATVGFRQFYLKRSCLSGEKAIRGEGG